MYKCKYFKIQELVNPSLLKEYGEDVCWMLFDDRILRWADYCREKYGPIGINYGGMVDCGARDLFSSTGAKLSAHKFFRALDLHVLDIENKNLPKTQKAIEYKKIRDELLKNKDWEFINFEISVGSEGITWLHGDTYNRVKREFNG